MKAKDKVEAKVKAKEKENVIQGMLCHPDGTFVMYCICDPKMSSCKDLTCD
jgi:hypothetical protein